MLVAVGGLSGTGKSVLARALAPSLLPQPGAVVLRSDVLRKQLFKVNETDRLPESAYQPEITEQIYEILVQRAVRVLSQGHSVVVDAVFAREERAQCDTRGRAQAKCPVCRAFSRRPTLRPDSAASAAAQRDASDATPEIAGLQETYDIGPVDWAIIDASGTPEQTLKQCQSQDHASGGGLEHRRQDQ